MSTELHLIRMMPNLNRLMPWAQRQGLVPDQGQGDLGYAFHAAFKAAFGELAPQPFSFHPGRGLLAYTSQADALRGAAAIATPELVEMLGLDTTADVPGLQMHPFPLKWTHGHCLGFELRVRPVVRKGNIELDAFLATAQRMPNLTLSRESVYVEWLQRQFADAALLHQVSMTEFKLSSVLRRSAPQPEGARPKRRVQGPDALFSGVLEVRNSEAFGTLVTRGIGRHRAFGFGMLLLKPVTDNGR